MTAGSSRFQPVPADSRRQPMETKYNRWRRRSDSRPRRTRGARIQQRSARSSNGSAGSAGAGCTGQWKQTEEEFSAPSSYTLGAAIDQAIGAALPEPLTVGTTDLRAVARCRFLRLLCSHGIRARLSRMLGCSGWAFLCTWTRFLSNYRACPISHMCSRGAVYLKPSGIRTRVHLGGRS